MTMSRCICGNPKSSNPLLHAVECPLAAFYAEPDDQNQLRPRTPQEYSSYVQGFLYGHKMTQEARHSLPTEIALETIIEGYRQMVGGPAMIWDDGKIEGG
jgi:hypothetical protein